MPQVAALAEDRIARDFIAVPLDLLQREAKLEFDLYLHGPTQMVLYREQHQAFSAAVLQRLTDNGISTLWVKGADERVLGQHIEAHLDEILSDPTVPPQQKANALYTSSRSLAMELLVSPDEGKLQRTRPLVAKTVTAVVGEPRVLSALIAALSTRYQLHTHCVNVSVYATAFARQLGYRELPVLTEIALGGLLHDLGKARIPESILQKPAPLDDREAAIMHMHPQWGVELLHSMQRELGRAREAILAHHEHWDGSGYPTGLVGNAIPISARIVAIVNAFDGLTTARAYERARSPFEALALMGDELSGRFDIALLRRFVPVWGPGGAADA